MKYHELVKSSVKPQEIEITETKVFVATDIEQVTVTVEEQEVQEYQFNLVEYEKDEYIKMISDKNNALEMNLTDTQIALCEVYELMI